MSDVNSYIAAYESADPEGQQRMIEETKTALTRAKNVQTRSMTQAKKWIAHATEAPNPVTLTELGRALEHANDTLDSLRLLVIRFGCISQVSQEVTALEREYDERCDKVLELKMKITKKLDEVERILQEPQASVPRLPPAQASGSEKPRSAPSDLKPEPLRFETSPTDFSAWVRSFRDYYRASRLETEEVSVQQSYLFACLSSSVKVDLEAKITVATPVLGEIGTSSCINTLTDMWRTRHPIFNRRIDFVIAKRGHGESVSELINRLLEMARDAEVQSMSVEDWVVQVTLQSMDDKRIHAKAMEQRELDLDSLRRVVASIESARTKTTNLNRSTQGPSSSQGSARVFANTGARPKSGGGGARPSSTPSSAPAQCPHCGCVPSHSRDSCQVYIRKVICKKCGHMGHIQKVCRQKPSTSKDTKSPNKSKKAPSKGPR